MPDQIAVSEIQEIFDQLESWGSPLDDVTSFDQAEDGIVVMRDAKGASRGWMPISVYEDIRKMHDPSKLQGYTVKMDDGENYYVAAYDLAGVPALIESCDLIDQDGDAHKIVSIELADDGVWRNSDFDCDSIGTITTWEAFEACKTPGVFGSSAWT
jgi:hypothetical protein